MSVYVWGEERERDRETETQRRREGTSKALQMISFLFPSQPNGLPSESWHAVHRDLKVMEVELAVLWGA